MVPSDNSLSGANITGLVHESAPANAQSVVGIVPVDSTDPFAGKGLRCGAGGEYHGVQQPSPYNQKRPPASHSSPSASSVSNGSCGVDANSADAGLSAQPFIQQADLLQDVTSLRSHDNSSTALKRISTKSLHTVASCNSASPQLSAVKPGAFTPPPSSHVGPSSSAGMPLQVPAPRKHSTNHVEPERQRLDSIHVGHDPNVIGPFDGSSTKRPRLA